jgi:hypothetical protein
MGSTDRSRVYEIKFESSNRAVDFRSRPLNLIGGCVLRRVASCMFSSLSAKSQMDVTCFKETEWSFSLGLSRVAVSSSSPPPTPSLKD